MSPGSQSPPSLRVRTICFHEDDREAASVVGAELFDRLTQSIEDPLGESAGIFVSVAEDPEQVRSISDGDILIPALGAGSAAFPKARQEVVHCLSEWHARAKDRVVPVLLDTAWLDRESALGGNLVKIKPSGNAAHARRRARVEILAKICRVFAKDLAFFVSHDPDYPAGVGAAQTFEAWVKDFAPKDREPALPNWSAFLSRSQSYGGEYVPLENRIRYSGRNAVVIAFRGPKPASVGEQRETLAAKASELPIVTVHVERTRWARSDPYGANGPGFAWPVDMDALGEAALAEWLESEYFQREGPRLLKLANVTEEGTEILSRRPEVVDAARWTRSSGIRDVLHPDPPLAVHEHELLRSFCGGIRFLTPTSLQQATGRMSLRGRQVALSISVPEGERTPEGITKEHLLQTLLALSRNLLSAGATLAYGGDFRQQGYTERLWEAITGYNQTWHPSTKLLNVWVAADRTPPERYPVELKWLGDDKNGGKTSKDACLKRTDLDVGIRPSPSVVAARSALFTSDMRRLMSAKCEARVVLGGQTKPKGSNPRDPKAGFGGAFSGVVEEALWTLVAGMPLYVVGGFGGAAKLVVDLIRQKTPPELSEDAFKENASFVAVAEQFSKLHENCGELRQKLPSSMNELADEVRRLSKAVFSDDAAAEEYNGLNLQENEQLWTSTDPTVIASLILRGLERVRPSNPPRLELGYGDLELASNIDSLLVVSAAQGADTAPWLVPRDGMLQKFTRLALDQVDSDQRSQRFATTLRNLVEEASQAAKSTLTSGPSQRTIRIGVLALPGALGLDVADLEDAWRSIPNELRSTKESPLDPERNSVTIVWVETNGGRFEALAKASAEHSDVLVWRPAAAIWDQAVRNASTVAEPAEPSRGDATPTLGPAGVSVTGSG